MDTNEQPQNIKDLLNTESTEEDFFRALEQVMPPEAKSQLGDDAGKIVGEAMMYLSVAAPAPATFDRAAARAMTLLGDQQLETAIEVMKHIGALTEQAGRLQFGDQELMDRAHSYLI